MLARRGSLQRYWMRRAVNRFASGISAQVVYLGGSITYGGGSTDYELYSWRGLTDDWLNKTYTKSTLVHRNAGVSGTPSWYGLVRLQTDVVDHNPELVFIDFATNDPDDDARGSRSDGFAPAAEALIRRLRTDLPSASLFVPIFTWPEGYSSLQASQIAARDKWLRLARRYNIPTVRLDREIQRLTGTNTPTDEQIDAYYQAPANVHPSNLGHLTTHEAIRRAMWPYMASASTAAQMAAMPARMYAESDDYEETPQIVNGTSLTEVGGTWTSDGTAVVSSDAGAKLSYTGTFCSFGLDAEVGAGQGVLAWSFDDVSYNNINLGAEPVQYFPVWNTTSDSRTVYLQVISGTVQINRFLTI